MLSITLLRPCCLENLSCLLAHWKALGARSRNPIFHSACRTWCIFLRCWLLEYIIEGLLLLLSVLYKKLYFWSNKARFSCTMGYTLSMNSHVSLKIKKTQVSMHVLSCRSKFTPIISYRLRLADLGSIVMSRQLHKICRLNKTHGLLVLAFFRQTFMRIWLWEESKYCRDYM